MPQRVDGVLWTSAGEGRVGGFADAVFGGRHVPSDERLYVRAGGGGDHAEESWFPSGRRRPRVAGELQSAHGNGSIGSGGGDRGTIWNDGGVGGESTAGDAGPTA